MFNIKDKFARDEIELVREDFYEFRRTVNDTNVETLFPLRKRVGDLDANMTTYIHQLQEKIQQQDSIIHALMNYLGVKVNYIEPDHIGQYEVTQDDK